MITMAKIYDVVVLVRCLTCGRPWYPDFLDRLGLCSFCAKNR